MPAGERRAQPPPIGYWGSNTGFVLWGIPGPRGDRSADEQLGQQEDTVPGQVRRVCKQRGKAICPNIRFRRPDSELLFDSAVGFGRRTELRHCQSEGNLGSPLGLAAPPSNHDLCRQNFPF